MRFSIGLTRLPLPQVTWASIDKQVEDTQSTPVELTAELAVKEDDNS